MILMSSLFFDSYLRIFSKKGKITKAYFNCQIKEADLKNKYSKMQVRSVLTIQTI